MIVIYLLKVATDCVEKGCSTANKPDHVSQMTKPDGRDQKGRENGRLEPLEEITGAAAVIKQNSQ
jgi:hypothetical protein